MNSIFLHLSIADWVNDHVQSFVAAYGDSFHDFSTALLRYVLVPLEGALRARARGERARFDPGWNDEAVAEHIAEANRLRVLLNGPLRGDLALFDWLNGLPVALR